MKRILFLLIAIIVVLHCACGLVRESNTFLDHLDEIEYIWVVELGDFDKETYTYDQIILTEISDIEVFKTELLDIEYGFVFGSPQTLDSGEIVIKILYDNGDYDLINHRAQIHIREGDSSYGYMYFDQEEFETLLNKYSAE